MPSPATAQTTHSVQTFRAESNLVVLDVTVVDKHGTPVVSGLMQSDFTIRQDGSPQRIFSFDPPAAGPAAAGNAPAAILVLDLMNTPSAGAAFARDTIHRYLADQPALLRSRTELLVLNNTTLVLAQPYTHSRGDLLHVLDHVPAINPDKLGAMQAGDPNALDERLTQSISALQQIAMQNLGEPGRKNILWVGAGGPGIGEDPMNPRYGRDVQFYIHQTTNLLMNARTSLFLIQPQLEGLGGQEALGIQGMDADTPVANYDADPFKGTINFGAFIHATGGKLFSERNDLARAMAEAQQLGSDYYTITYQPPGAEDNGSFHSIQVTLRDPHLHTLTSTGYYAAEPPTRAEPDPHAIDPMYEIEEAAQAGLVADPLGLSLVRVVRHPDSGTVEIITLLPSRRLRWSYLPDGRSASNITVVSVSLSKHMGILASQMRRLTVFSSSQKPAQLAASGTLVTTSVPMPGGTESIRVIVLAQDGGQVGTLEVKHEVLDAAPATPTPNPVLRERVRGG